MLQITKVGAIDTLKRGALLSVGILVALSVYAHADMAQIKLYKEAYPDSKPKCIECHTAALPKKDGDHTLNQYGQTVKDKGGDSITVETYKGVGPIATESK